MRRVHNSHSADTSTVRGVQAAVDRLSRRSIIHTNASSAYDATATPELRRR